MKKCKSAKKLKIETRKHEKKEDRIYRRLERENKKFERKIK